MLTFYQWSNIEHWNGIVTVLYFGSVVSKLKKTVVIVSCRVYCFDGVMLQLTFLFCFKWFKSNESGEWWLVDVMQSCVSVYVVTCPQGPWKSLIDLSNFSRSGKCLPNVTVVLEIVIHISCSQTLANWVIQQTVSDCAASVTGPCCCHKRVFGKQHIVDFWSSHIAVRLSHIFSWNCLM